MITVQLVTTHVGETFEIYSVARKYEKVTDSDDYFDTFDASCNFIYEVLRNERNICVYGWRGKSYTIVGTYNMT